MQVLFAVPLELDGLGAVLSSVRLSQYPRPWYDDPSRLDLCGHSVYIGGREVDDGPDWETRRSRVGYSIWLSRETIFADGHEIQHRCSPDYEDHLLGTIYRELATVRAPGFADAPLPSYHGATATHADGGRLVSYAHRSHTTRFKVHASDVQPRPFARSIEAIVRSLAPTFKVTEMSLGSWPRDLLQAVPVAATGVTQ